VPGQQLALLYGISDVGLAKACKRHNIPRPPRGYWARIAAGQQVRKPPLSKPRLANELVYLKRWNMSDDTVQKLVEDNRLSSVAQVMPASMEPHPLVLVTRQQLLASKPDHDGLLHATIAALNVRISPSVVDRATAVLDALIKRWESRGGTVAASVTASGENTRARFAIGPDSFGVELLENVDEKKPLTDQTRLTGYLSLHITGDERRQFRRRWSDTKTQRLERMLGAFVETVANALAVIRQERLDAECVARQKGKVDAIRKAASTDASREFYFRQQLMQNVDRWHNAERVRAFLTALKEAVNAGQWRPKDENQFATWMEWAERFANSMDPLFVGSIAEGKSTAPKNTGVAELDLTTATKSAINDLGVADTDALWKQNQDAVRKASDGNFGSVWNEITRVLEGLHYDVSKRERATSWW
jgi:hypothetical protein